jgi:hypothetical protein
MKRMILWVMSVLLALTCFNISQESAIAAGTNLVKNGSFEQPDASNDYLKIENPIEGWQSSENIGIEVDHQKLGEAFGNPKLYQPYDGTQLVELDSYSAVNRIYQDIPTEAGKTYKLSFAFSPRPDTVDNKLNVRWGDTPVAQLSKSGAGLSEPQWELDTYYVKANNASTRLSFDNLNETSDGMGSFLDAISLEPFECQLPGNCQLLLHPDETVSIPVKIKVPESAGTLPLDLMLTQDVTASYNDDLPVLQRLIPDLVQQLRNLQPDTTFGLATFTDKKAKGTAQFYVYKTSLPLTKEANSFQQAVGQLTTLAGGTDYPESSLSALFQVALRADGELKFRQGTRRVALVSTDDAYHQAGDLPGKANNGDTVLEDNEDYPSVAQTREAIKRANLLPVFLVTSNFKSTYDNLLNQLGVGGAVVPLSSNSSDLVSAIKKGLEVANQNLAIAILNDTNNYVNSVTPERFSNVTPGSEVTTSVNFKYSGKGSGENVTVRALGLGDLVIDVTVAL